jgi:protein required for attachment to host cells
MVPEHFERLTDTRPDVPQTTNLAEDLRELAQRAPDAERPYLTVTLDYQPDGGQPNFRPATRWLKEREQELAAEHGPRGPLYDAVTEGMRALHEALDGLANEPPQGVIFVAQPAAGEFRTIPLAVPAPNSATVCPTPNLAPLARLTDAWEPFALLVADSKQAFLHTFTLGSRAREVAMTNAKRDLQPGAVSNRMIEWKALSAAEQALENFAKAIAEETWRVMNEDAIPQLIIAADDQLTSTLKDHLPKEVRDRFIGTMAADIRDTPAVLLQRALPVIEEAKRAREEDVVQRLTTAALSPGGLGVFGVAETLAALQNGQVQDLVLADDFAARGWADDALGIVGAGEVPTEHPAGGDVNDLRPIDLVDAMIRLAIQTDARVTFVTTRNRAVTESPNEAEETHGERDGAAQALQEHGGIGAILRFRLSDAQATAEVQ